MLLLLLFWHAKNSQMFFYISTIHISQSSCVCDVWMEGKKVLIEFVGVSVMQAALIFIGLLLPIGWSLLTKKLCIEMFKDPQKLYLSFVSLIIDRVNGTSATEKYVLILLVVKKIWYCRYFTHPIVKYRSSLKDLRLRVKYTTSKSMKTLMNIPVVYLTRLRRSACAVVLGIQTKNFVFVLTWLYLSVCGIREPN